MSVNLDSSCVVCGLVSCNCTLFYDTNDVSRENDEFADDGECPGDFEEHNSESWEERHVVPPSPNIWIAGRLKSRLDVWREMGASDWVLRVLAEGYKLPLVCEPKRKRFSNHQSAFNHQEFVDSAIAELVQCGSAKEAHGNNVCVISPPGAVEGKKLRLILDLRYVNSHLATFPFKCDGLDCLVDMYTP